MNESTHSDDNVAVSVCHYAPASPQINRRGGEDVGTYYVCSACQMTCDVNWVPPSTVHTKTPPLSHSIAALDEQIQRLYREKDALEQQRDAVDAPALIALLISSGTHFVLHHTYKGRATLLTESDGPIEKAIIAYIGDLFRCSSKPIAKHLHVHFENEEAYVSSEWTEGASKDQTLNLLGALKAIGIPQPAIKLSDYEHEVANDARNLARSQIELDRIRALVQAY